MDEKRRRPFEGIRVVDATHVLAGPFCSYQLALLGADVMKIEAPGAPDVARGRGPDDASNADGMGLNYLVQGSNKRAMSVDFATPDGVAILEDLVRTSDVFIENFRAGALEAFGLGSRDLLALNPRLVHCSITGFGRGGDRAEVNAYDNVIQAASGLMAQTRAPSGAPVKSGASHVDYTTGYAASFAIAAALFERESSGRGQVIDCSMYETALTLMAPEAAALLKAGPKASRPKEAGLGTYDTADGLIVLGAFNVRQNRRLWTALGRPDFAALSDWPGIWREATAMRTALEAIMPMRTAAEWETLLHELGVPAERVRTLAEAVSMPHLAARGFYHAFGPDGRVGAVTVPLAPFRYADGGPSIERGAPGVGEHTRELLRELGRSDDAIDALYVSGAVA